MAKTFVDPKPLEISLTATVDQIWNARARVKENIFKGLGEPAIQIPTEQIHVAVVEGVQVFTIKMDDLIKLTASILDVHAEQA